MSGCYALLCTSFNSLSFLCYISASAVRHQWTRQEKEALTRQFKKNINLGKTPGRLDCVNAIKNETCLSSFHWKKIKFAVKNLISAQKRSIQKLKLH